MFNNLYEWKCCLIFGNQTFIALNKTYLYSYFSLLFLRLKGVETSLNIVFHMQMRLCWREFCGLGGYRYLWESDDSCGPWTNTCMPRPSSFTRGIGLFTDPIMRILIWRLCHHSVWPSFGLDVPFRIDELSHLLLLRLNSSYCFII